MDKAEYITSDITSDILAWYDVNARTLPWRAKSSKYANPYHVWLSEIMLQQTVVKAAIPYFLKFVEKWPGIEDLAKASQEEIMEQWAGLGYYSRARNLHKCAKIIASEI
jgi:A/G-specific adenine glycosylase